MLMRLRERIGAAASTARIDLPADAAVLIALTDQHDPEVILTVRSAHLKSHAGEVAFPGGKCDHGDRDLVETALRESSEEIGLDPTQVEVVGYGRQHRSRFGLQVRPIVGIVPADVALAANDTELTAVFRVPLSYFLVRENLLIEAVEHEGRVMDMPCYPWSGWKIWGLTAIMLIDVLNVGYDFGVVIRR